MNMQSLGTVTTIFVLGISSVAVADAEVKVNVTGIENEQGVIGVAVYSEELQDEFPDGNALEKKAVDANRGGVSVTFNIVEPGSYAISVMHDENNNGKLDTNFLGMPKEPYGNSGEYTSLKPKFENSRFFVENKNIEIDIKVH